jgi:hypothetical protein
MDRWEWIEQFKTLNLTTSDIMNMSEEDFICLSNFLHEAGLAPKSFYHNNSIDNNISSHNLNNSFRTKENHDQYQEDQTNQKEGYEEYKQSLKEDQKIRNEQDEEYKQALKEEAVNEEIERMGEFREIQKKKIEKEHEIFKEEKIKIKNMIKDEGDIQIAFLFPNGKRFLHKFWSNSLGQILYDFVSGFDEIYDNNNNFQPFYLIHGLNQKIDPNFLLDEQEISNREVVKIIFE